MDSGKDRNVNSEEFNRQEEKQQAGAQFNAGHNDSDYDGGHPGDNILKNEEQASQQKAKEGQFNAGGNDSDYDGGHPEDSSSSKK